jgi:SAM-dependent methyltransferase
MNNVPSPDFAAKAMLTCPACRQTTRHNFHLRIKECIIWRCETCGLGRTETSGFDPSAYYTGEYFSGQHSDGYSDYLGAEPVLRREFAHSLDLIRGYCHSGKLLELGCAYGFFLKEAERYFDVVGIELAEDAADHARRSGLNVLSGVADEPNMQKVGDVDIIALFDVIEHLPDPRETLALCERRLKPGGIIVITTGDFGSMAARLFGAWWRLMTPPQHLWFFTRDAICRLSTSLGLSLERLDHPGKIVPLSLIIFQLSRIFGLRAGAKLGSASQIGVPVNLFDAMRIVLRKPPS